MALPSGPDKSRFVRSMFDAIAARYDLMNRLMTGGRDEAWRRLAAAMVSPEIVRVAVDVGAGTGDLSLALARLAPAVRVLAVDFSPEMLQLADAKCRRQGVQGRVLPVLGDAMALPLHAGSSDAVVTGFTLRNVADVATVFAECHRILRFGGRIAVLELTRTRTPLLRELFHLYFHRLVPLLGAIVSGQRFAYEYLPASVQVFPDAESLKSLLEQAGFTGVTYRKLALGTVALHVAEKPAGDRGRGIGGQGSEDEGRTKAFVVRPSSFVFDQSHSQLNDAREALAVREITSRDEWTALMTDLPNAHLLQSWEWGELRRATGWTPRRLAFERGGRVLAAAALIRRPLRLGPLPLTPGWGFSYCPKGPVLDYGDTALLEEVLRLLANEARRTRSIFLKVDPDIMAGDEAAARALRRAGYVPAGSAVQSDSTVLLNVAASDDELMKRMRSTWRRYIRNAQRDGVTVREATIADLDTFYRIHKGTSDRQEFVPRPKAYYDRAFRLLKGARMGALFLAEHGGVAEAVLFAARFGRRAWYLYGGHTEKGGKLHAAYLLQWHTMRWARDLGCEAYDMWGAANDPADTNDPLHGVTYLKLGFGGRHVRWLSVYDYAVVPPLYHAWNLALPRFLHLLRTLRGERASPAAGQ